VLEAEISREQIPLRNAYRHVGQKASVRVNSGVEAVLPGAHLHSPHHDICACCSGSAFPQLSRSFLGRFSDLASF
jgi:hypothetical protein